MTFLDVSHAITQTQTKQLVVNTAWEPAFCWEVFAVFIMSFWD